MSLNVGQVLERVVRRDRMGISELSRKLNVSRRTIYNWFDQKSLNPEIIWKVGSVIGHDFSIELPETFAKTSNNIREAFDAHTEDFAKGDANSVYFWMNKYIKLLEKYNEILSHTNLDKTVSEKVAHHTMPRNNSGNRSVA
ncbi:helix-turn-helix domain-containing protein [Pedobacter soli]|uniref:HTH cro/C1-type domain-containing protein n=1 Tax=Pedobacter soli TaxID=390242 RepID=A0A1G6SVT5_9SPHI|nr:helix-turn-helix domain containing protein [Pedobacter soli]SDD20245.1 hypothetical protein SAMN04488024_104360 [Pedobacter soli]